MKIVVIASGAGQKVERLSLLDLAYSLLAPLLFLFQNGFTKYTPRYHSLLAITAGYNCWKI